jgi:hypothetical protein
MKELDDGGAFYIVGNRIILRGNYVHDIQVNGVTGSSAYYLDEQAEDSMVEGNLSVDVARPSLDHMALTNTIRGNVFVVNGNSHLDFPRSVGHVLESNVIYATGELAIKVPTENSTGPNHQPVGPAGRVIIRNNVFFSGAGKAELLMLEDYTIKERIPLESRDGNVVADPMFVNREKRDFRFLPGSPAIKMGIVPLDVRSTGPR